MSQVLPEVLQNCFDDIDISGDGQISVSELRRYLKKMGIDDKNVEQCISTCNVDSSGNITRSNFEISFKTQLQFGDAGKTETEPVQNDVKIIASDMGPGLEKNVIRIVRQDVAKSANNKDLAKAIKTSLDKRIDTLFHVVIVKGQYWAFYSHEPKCSLVFSMGGLIFIIWKTPAY